MAYFDKKTGQIVLSPDDQKMFKETGIIGSLQNQDNRTPISNHIMEWIWGPLKDNRK